MPSENKPLELPASLGPGPDLARLALRLLGANDLDRIVQLRETVLGGAARPDLRLAELEDAAFLLSHLGGARQAQGETLGVFDGQALVACALLGLPEAGARSNLGRALPPGSCALHEVAHFAGCLVLPAWRGRHLHRTLLAQRAELARHNGRRICAAKIALQDAVGRHNLLASGLCIAAVGDFDGMERQVLALHLTRPWTFSATDRLQVDGNDFATQRALVAQGWWGIAEMPGAAGPTGMLLFARHQPPAEARWGGPRARGMPL